MTREHGTRAKYVVEKCRCDDCTQANREYQRALTRRVAPTMIGSARARRHLQELRFAGVGLRTISETTGIGRSALTMIRQGKRSRIKVETERAILGVTPRDTADHARVIAEPTWRNVQRLIDAGWTKAAIARAIGQTNGALQLGKHKVLARHARTIAALVAEHCPPQRNEPAEPPARWEGDTSWMANGACRQTGVPTWMFFPGLGDSTTLQKALGVCATCRVTTQCLNYALTNNTEGVWGGTTGRERQLMRRQRKAS